MSSAFLNELNPASCDLLSADSRTFARNFNTRSFEFRHELVGHPLFELPRLTKVAERMLERGELGKFVALRGSRRADENFTSLEPRERLAATIERLEETGTWLKLSSLDAIDPAYGELLQSLLAKIEQLAGVPVRSQITWSSMTVFLASPRIITPYHIDHECNFLMQVAGEKIVTLYDPFDRSILSELEIEDFYSGNFEAARFHEALSSRGTDFRLSPGVAVHHPPLAPHWVRNGASISISVSIGFCMRQLDRRAHLYQVNGLLRKLGLRPTPPGQSHVLDWMKMAGMDVISKSAPVTQEDILYSGLQRLRAPRQVWKRVRGTLKK